MWCRGCSIQPSQPSPGGRLGGLASRRRSLESGHIIRASPDQSPPYYVVYEGSLCSESSPRTGRLGRRPLAITPDSRLGLIPSLPQFNFILSSRLHMSYLIHVLSRGLSPSSLAPSDSSSNAAPSSVDWMLRKSRNGIPGAPLFCWRFMLI